MTTKKSKPLHPHSALIDALGGPATIAKIFDIKPPSVCEWRERGIPDGRLKTLRILHPATIKRVERSHN